MRFSEIIEHLRDLSVLEVISSDIDEEITEVKFIDPRQKQFSSSVLYFSNRKQDFNSLPPQCIITDQNDINNAGVAGGNIALVPENDFGYVFNSVFQMVADSHKDRFYDSLMRTLDGVRNVDALIDIASQAFGASLIFIDRDFRIQGYSTQIPVTDKLWKRNIEQGYCDYEFIKAVKSLKSVQMSDSSMSAIEVSCTSSPFKKFSCKVFCRDIWVGYIIVIENNESYRPEHAEMLKTLSGVLGYAVMKYEPNYLYMTSEYHSFLYNLIIGADISSLPEAYRNLSFPSEMQVFYCRATANKQAFPQERDLTNHLASVFPDCHVIGRRHSAAILGSHSMLSRVGLMLSAFPSECHVKVGTSLPFEDISELKSHYDEAHDAFELGETIDPDLSIYTFEDYGLYVMLRTVESSENLSRYLHPALPKLAAYDLDNGSNLELTLHTYLKCACNTTETAESLFLHRNSVIYRLRRIEELCGIDLNDTDLRFRLRLSFAINNVINGKRKWNAERPASG
ncbi:MAG: helix-turn-helix domain-containing protein [Mogibacterium sp.]|nr:helix-turn-helix domain-containing protein [Mogibacterium sp.]